MVIEKELSLLKIKELSNQIFDYFSLTFYDLESQLDSKLDLTKKNFETFADRHFISSIDELLIEADKIKKKFPDTFIQIKKTTNELRSKFDEIINRKLFDLSSIEKLKNNLNNYLDKMII